MTDAATATALYNVLYFGNISTINFDGLGGADTVEIESLPTGVVLPDGTSLPTNGSFKINIDGGQLAASAATVVLDGSSSGGDTFAVTPGATSDAGSVSELLNGAVAATTITFRRTRLLNINGSGTGTDNLTVNGTGNGDSFVAGPQSGRQRHRRVVQVDSFVPVQFAALGGGSSTVTLAGGNGARVQHARRCRRSITAVGGGLATANQATVNGTSSADSINVKPTAAGAASVQVNALGLVTITNTGKLAINGRPQAAL